MPTWSEQLSEIQKMRIVRNEIEEKIYSDRSTIEKINKELESIRQKLADANPQREGELERTKASLERHYQQRRDQLQLHIADLNKHITGIYTEPHPKSVVGQLDDAIPFLLFPVRIETRFMTDLSRPELWLRIYPDEIMIHTHESSLTQDEVSNGEQYWRNIFEAEKHSGDDAEERKKSAWSNVVTMFGAGRSAWITRQTKPVNWNDRATLGDAGDLTFPEHDTSTSDWTRAPRTTLLPDKFVVILYRGENVREEMGNPVPDVLKVGPDPKDPDGSFVTDDNKLVFGEDFNWTSNFDKAVSMGMGLKILLNEEEARSGFDKVVVLGLMLSMSEEETRKEVENLISNHHYSPNGFSIVTQGTATNNTEQEGSGYTTSDPFHEAGYEETGEPLFDADDEKDARYLADAIGISYEPLQFIENGNAADRRHATAMNTALYPSTLGYYFDTLLRPAVSESNQKNLREFFTRYVSGRGPLPAIRVSNQPYGVLVTSDFSKWAWSRNERAFDPSFLNGMHKLLQYYEGIWKSFLDQLVYVGKPGVDPEQAMMNILGLQAGSVEFYQRNAFSTDDLRNRDEFEYGGRYYIDMQEGFTSKNLLLDFITTNGGSIRDENGTLKVPQLLRLIFQHYHTRLDSANLIDSIPLSEKNGISAYNESDGKNYLNWLAEIEKVAQLESQNFGEGVQPPSSLLYMQLRRALLLQLHKSTVKWLETKGHAVDLTSRAVNFYNIQPQPTPTKWELLKAKVSLVDPAHHDQQISIADYLLGGQVSEDETEFLKKQKTALEELAKISSAALERCFTEHLDTCNYRLDAWQTAMFTYRLENMRRSVEGRQGRRTGVYCGCYGFVEDLRPESRRRIVNDRERVPRGGSDRQPLYEYADNGGFVLAPSINHAVAASVLRAGYLSHADSSNPDVLSVNLSSERVRRALFVLEGIRNGQRLEVLLGYQFERGLHDRASANPNLARLNEHIYAYRDVYKIPVHYIRQQGTTETETIEANNVVNGLLLAETKSAYPYGAVIPPPIDAAHDPRASIEAEKNRLEDTLDAIKDLLLSESVYQMSRGNVDRAGAVLNAMQEGSVPPEIEIIRTPRSSNFTFTNRITLHFEDESTSENPWSPVHMTERAMMEPGLNVWLGKVLGNFSSISCIVSEKSGETEINPLTIGIDKLNLQPIDIIYLSAEEIQARFAREYRKLSGIGNDTAVSIDHHSMKPMLPLLELLRSVLNGGRPLTAADFVPPSQASQVTAHTEPAELANRLNAAKNKFDIRLDLLNALPITIEGSTSTLGDTFSDLEETGDNFADVSFSFSGGTQLIEILIAIDEFGVPDSYPLVSAVTDDNSAIVLLNQAFNISRRMKQASDEAAILIGSATMPEADKRTTAFTEATKLLFGNAFTVFPKFRYVNPTDISSSNNDRNQLLKHATTQLGMPLPVDEWIQTVSHVRSKIRDWEQIRTYVELNAAETIEALPVQIPYRANDSWIAVEFPAEYAPGKPFTIERDTLSVVAHGQNTFDVSALQSGLLIDDFTQSIPVKEEMAGLTFNYDQPSAMAPQALLLAVSPELDGRWSWDHLVGIINDTFLRAKLRAVEPALLDKLNNPQTGILLPALLASFSQYDLDFALDYRLNLDFFQEHAPILNAMATTNE